MEGNVVRNVPLQNRNDVQKIPRMGESWDAEDSR